MLTDKEAYDMAEKFFRNDYNDRGMVKWQGFYLSDHTEDAKKHSDELNRLDHLSVKTQMSEVDISAILFRSFTKNETIRIQLNLINDEGKPQDFITGIVQGFNDNQVYVNDTEIEIDTINWCEVILE